MSLFSTGLLCTSVSEDLHSWTLPGYINDIRGGKTEKKTYIVTYYSPLTVASGANNFLLLASEDTKAQKTGLLYRMELISYRPKFYILDAPYSDSTDSVLWSPNG